MNGKVNGRNKIECKGRQNKKRKDDKITKKEGK